MTKQELIKMMGDEDKADWALLRVLEQSLQTDAELQICQECRESLQDYVLKVADEIATEYRETGVYNRDKLAQLKVDCDDIGWEVCEDPEYIMVEDQVFYLHERE